VRSAPPAHSHRKTKQAKRSGRPRAPSTAGKAVKVISITAPALALVGAVATAQAQPVTLNPAGSSDSSYNLHAAAAASMATQASRQTVTRHAASGKDSAAKTTKKPANGAAATRKSAGATPSAAASKAPSAGTSGQSTSGQPGAAQPSPSASPSTSPATLTCTGTPGTGMLPLNYVTIVNFLIAHGYSDMAAAGIAGNIYQESGGNPESVGTGGGGLIGWTPLPAGFVTGNPEADLQTQLAALLTYNQGWSQYIPMLNAATNPTDAADIYMNYFERPGLPAAANREGAAEAVAQACGITG
jgi:hypothetical protein